MAKKGGSKALKRLNAPRAVHVQRKKAVFLARPRPGPHPLKQCISLGFAIRDLLGLADNMKEAKMIIRGGKVEVDGRVVKEHRYPIGFMDVVSIPSVDQYYRVLYDRKARIELRKIDRREAGFKLCKIRNKTTVKGGKTQLNLHDGKNLLSDKKHVVGSVVKLELPSLKILEEFPMQKGGVAYVTGGQHAGEIGSVEAITAGTAQRTAMITLKSEKKEFETRKELVFILGTKEPAIKLGGE